MPDAPIVVVWEKPRIRAGNAKVVGDQAQERGSMELPVSPDDEASCRAVVEHAATRPFLVFRPDRHRWDAGPMQRRGAATGQFGPEFEMTYINGQHIAIGNSLFH